MLLEKHWSLIEEKLKIPESLIWIKRPAIQRIFSRVLKEKQYEKSLKECLGGEESEVFKQLHQMHVDHIKKLVDNEETRDVIDWLRQNLFTLTDEED